MTTMRCTLWCSKDAKCASRCAVRVACRVLTSHRAVASVSSRRAVASCRRVVRRRVVAVERHVACFSIDLGSGGCVCRCPSCRRPSRRTVVRRVVPSPVASCRRVVTARDCTNCDCTPRRHDATGDGMTRRTTARRDGTTIQRDGTMRRDGRRITQPQPHTNIIRESVMYDQADFDHFNLPV